MEGQDLGVKVSLTNLHAKTSDYWGYFWREVGYKSTLKFEDLTLEAAAEMEWNAIGKILHRALAHSQQLRQANQAAADQYHVHGHGHGSFSVAARNNIPTH